MIRGAILFASLGTLLLHAPSAHAQVGVATTNGSTLVDRAFVERRLADIGNEVESARAQCAADATCARSSIAQALYRASVNVQSLRGELSLAAPSPFAPACPYAPRAGTRPVAMSPEEFNALAGAVQAASLPARQVELAKNAALKKWLSAEQITDLLAAMGFGATRLAALEHLATKLADPENAYSIERLFETNSDRERVRRILTEASGCPGATLEERTKAGQNLPRLVSPAATPVYVAP